MTRRAARSRHARVLIGAASVFAWSSACAPDPRHNAGENRAVGVDHHVHLLSADLIRDWKSLGVPFSRPDSAYIEAATVLGDPDADPGPALEVERAVLVPMAHLYGRGAFREALELSVQEEYRRVRHENDHVAGQAAGFPGRAVAFCAIDFLRPYAWEEMSRCLRELRVAGIKLHLASAGTDLRDSVHVRKLAEIAAWAESERIAVMIHFDPQRRGLEVADVERFITHVLEPFPDLIVLIPHLGGSGGYGPWTEAVFGAFADWLEDESGEGRARPGVFFDVSAAWLAQESEGVPASTDEQAAALRRDLRRVGIERVVFGSDYPVFDPGVYAGELEAALGLEPEEWEALIRNAAPVFSASRRPY